MSYYVYIIASRKDGAIYISVTDDIVRRIYEHRIKAVPGFASRYDITRLVWFEICDDPIFAISREKRIEEMEAKLEDSIDRAAKSAVGRFVRVYL